ncbi:dehydrogenase/reductase SDR family member 1 isoform X3 [Mustela putorius furo]|uniref:Dehydrogenase/reductase SDR family member 1 isoform X3 n=1 Tax=Mustela putorius furo TaxID=9669 RepID=A0A8U0RGR7_MUSPF|nr:dehydrogenase/reductase SDR family member 1 isoform X3 [Mustela putorius furo]
MCWSTTPMPESQYSLNLDSSSTFLTSPSDPGMLIPTHRSFHYPAPHAFLPSNCPTHHISCAFQALMKNIKKPFWEAPASIWDDINNVGLRGHYLCSVYGARLMVPAGRGLIVVISSLGGLQYLFNVPYGVGKAACDRLATDCARELRRHGVSYVSLWPGLVQTELVKEAVMKNNDTDDPLLKELRSNFSSAETTEMSGKCVVALATAVSVLTDPNILSLSGKVLPSCDLAQRYSLQDVDGRPVQDYLSLRSVLSHGSSLGWLASYLPGFLRMPKWIMTLYASKF